jgi:hypothetical protein
MIKTKTITIDGDDYVITQLGAITGRRIWLKLAKIIAAPMRVLGSAKGISEESMAAALAAAVTEMDEATIEELYAAYGPRCTVRVGERSPELQGEVFDQHFAGRYLTMSKWLLECTLFNFADFLGATSLGSIATTIQAMMSARQSKSPKDLTGTSGES